MDYKKEVKLKEDELTAKKVVESAKMDVKKAVKYNYD